LESQLYDFWKHPLLIEI